MCLDNKVLEGDEKSRGMVRFFLDSYIFKIHGGVYRYANIWREARPYSRNKATYGDSIVSSSVSKK